LSQPDSPDGPKVGFTASKAVGSAVVRNRMKRRLREAVRLHLAELPARFRVVLNARKPLAEAEFAQVEREIQTLFRRCANS
jgi:ribonuclease P protein component